MSENILILGGTKEAAAMATSLVTQGKNVTTSLAGRTKQPRPIDGNLRIGGFGGIEKMAEWIRENRITLVIDATHPFAHHISKNAIEATRLANVPLEICQRPEWPEQAGDIWIHASSLINAANEIPSGARVFLALGSQHLAVFFKRDDVHFTIRMVDPPSAPLPFLNQKILANKPPSKWEAEAMLFEKENISHIVCRNSGGSGGYAKIEAARMLALPVIMVGREL